MEKSRSESLVDPDKEQVIRVLPDGTTVIDWVSVSFSGFIIDYVYNEEERELATKYGSRKIYCG